ncbi:hypothetical protein OSTOST_07840 [Ostertagia ostertagi]
MLKRFMFSCITRLVLNAKLSSPQGKDGRGEVKLTLNDRQREKKKCNIVGPSGIFRSVSSIMTHDSEFHLVLAQGQAGIQYNGGSLWSSSVPVHEKDSWSWQCVLGWS